MSSKKTKPDATSWLQVEILEQGTVLRRVLHDRSASVHLALRLGENPDLVSNKTVNRPLIEWSQQWTAATYAQRRLDSATDQGRRSDG